MARVGDEFYSVLPFVLSADYFIADNPGVPRPGRILAIIFGILIFIAGANLGVPAIGTLIRYYVYARPHLTQNFPAGGVALASPVFGLVVNSLLGLILAAAGIALVKRFR
ncbi:MAG TPA: hypothetical protein VG028_10145 [Terriglobia bacterium]|nr:hypothetical protein [Terriglobia bacterium]